MPEHSNWQSGQVIALVCILTSTFVSVDIFMYSRSDHDMKLLALGAVISQISAVMATASTLLVGKVFTSEKPNPADLPQGAVQTESTVTQIAPITPTA